MIGIYLHSIGADGALGCGSAVLGLGAMARVLWRGWVKGLGWKFRGMSASRTNNINESLQEQYEETLASLKGLQSALLVKSYPPLGT